MRAAARPARVALYGFLGSGNIGNDASLETVLAWFADHRPDVRLSAITIAPDVVRARFGLPSTLLSSPGPTTGALPGPVRKLLGRLHDVPRTFRMVGSVDAVVVPGMGVLEEQLGVRPWGLPAWIFLMSLTCRLRRRPFVLLAVGAEPILSPLSRLLFRWTVRLAAHTGYRDDFSAAAMRAAGAGEPDAVSPDLVFAHPVPAAVAEPGCLVVGVMAYYGRRDDPSAGRQVRRRYVDTLADALQRLLEPGGRLILLGGDRVDTEVAHEVESVLRQREPGLEPGAVEVRDVATFDDLARSMSAAEVVVGSRFHNVICALTLGRPTVSIGYADKNRVLMGEMGLAEYCQDIEILDADRLVEQVRQARDQQRTLTVQIARACHQFETEVRSMLHDVVERVLGLPSAPGTPGDGRTTTGSVVHRGLSG